MVKVLDNLTSELTSLKFHPKVINRMSKDHEHIIRVANISPGYILQLSNVQSLIFYIQYYT